MMDELFNSGMITMLSRQVDNLQAKLDKFKENQLAIEEIQCLIENVAFIHDHTKSKHDKEMFKNIIRKLLKQKETLESEENNN